MVLHQGQPAQLATPMEVFARPADTYVAGFIGAPTMNFLPATLARDRTAAQLEGGLLLPLGDGRRPGADGDRLIIGIRPEHLSLGAGLDLVIDLIEPLGRWIRPPACALGRRGAVADGEAGRSSAAGRSAVRGAAA